MTASSAKKTVGIAGAGLMGRMMALCLSDAGYQVTLFDSDTRDGHGSCAWVAGGMLAPFTELEKAEPIISRLGQDALALWPDILSRLAAPVFFQQAGTLVVAHRQDMTDLAAFQGTIASRLTDASYDAASMEQVDANRLSQLEPELVGRFDRGVFFPGEGQLEPQDLLPALAETLLQRGVSWHEQITVSEVTSGRIRCGEQVMRFDLAVDTRGLGARDALPLRGVRGEVMRFHAPDVGLHHMVRLMHPRYPLYIVPRPNDVYLIGATSIESDDVGPVTVRSSLELLSAVYSLHPGFAEAAVLAQLVGCRPAFSSNLPKIMHEPGLLRINGLYRHGFLISPALAQTAMGILQGQAPCYPEICEVAHASTHG